MHVYAHIYIYHITSYHIILYCIILYAPEASPRRARHLERTSALTPALREALLRCFKSLKASKSVMLN